MDMKAWKAFLLAILAVGAVAAILRGVDSQRLSRDNRAFRTGEGGGSNRAGLGHSRPCPEREESAEAHV